MKRSTTSCLILLAVLATTAQTTHAETPVVEWARQLGTASDDIGRGVSVDGSGNAYVTGSTKGDLDGNTNAGGSDMFLTKYDTTGVKLWTEQLGTASGDYALGVSIDGSGNAYVTGHTGGGLDGNTSAGGIDMFLTKYDTAGTKLWTEQLGLSDPDVGCDVSVDGNGNAYVTGYTNGGLDGNTSAGGLDMFLVKISTLPELFDVLIDIKPDGDPNSINLDSNGNIPVVIFSTDTFDATTVDPATIMLADAGVMERGKKGDLMASFEDVDVDGLLDLLVHIDTQGLVLSDGDVEALLTGETFDGLSILGTDAIRLVGSSGGQSTTAFTSEDAAFAVSAVPEPSMLVGLLGLCLAGLLGWTRRG